MNRERNGKLLTSTGFEVLTRRQKWRKRPDGGVVTQRTANPLSLAYFRDFLSQKVLTLVGASHRAFVPTANSHTGHFVLDKAGRMTDKRFQGQWPA
jgi:hypothetical protein